MERKPKNIFVNGAITPQFIATSIAKHQSQTGIGAHQIFLGQVRADVINQQVVQAITYTANEVMALEEMHTIREAIFQEFPLTCLHVYHSLGTVKAGEICLFVFVSAKHRKAAMQACEVLVEAIKTKLPVWGKEIFENETYQWKENN